MSERWRVCKLLAERRMTVQTNGQHSMMMTTKIVTQISLHLLSRLIQFQWSKQISLQWMLIATLIEAGITDRSDPSHTKKRKEKKPILWSKTRQKLYGKARILFIHLLQLLLSFEALFIWFYVYFDAAVVQEFIFHAF